MGDSLITVISIMLAAVLLFVFPMMTMAERNDDISLSTVQTAINEFGNNVTSTGKITQANYDQLIQKIYSTGNTYDVNMELQVLDTNPGKKAADVSQNKIGENLYYSKYTSQINSELSQNHGEMVLKEGDIFSASATNTNVTFSQMFKNFFYSLSGNNTYKISANYAGVVMVDGK